VYPTLKQLRLRVPNSKRPNAYGALNYVSKWPELTAVVERSLLMTNHDPRMMRQELERIREWSIERLAAGTERPWSWYQYMKLREATESILAGMDVAEPTEDSQGPSSHLRLVGAVDLQPH
jgi:hypothetical protein